MFDIGAQELFVLAVVALVVVGPKELPGLLRSLASIVRKGRELTAEFKDGLSTLANEAEQELDPFHELREEEGLKPGMSPEEITNHIMSNREREASQGDDAGISEQNIDAPEKPASEKPIKTTKETGETS